MPSGCRLLLRACVLAATAVVLAALALPGMAHAAAGDIGTRGFAFAAPFSGTSITGSKPESKLWFNDGSWWADMTTGAAHHIFRLDRATGTWQDTGTALDTRFRSVSDVRWSPANGKLYVASHTITNSSSSSASGTDGRLWRLTFDPATDRYTPDAGFPVPIGSPTTESLVIDRDSTGVLWATWQAGGRIYVNRTGASDAEWGTPFVLPGSVATNSDDLSSLIAFDGNKIGVVWSNQTPGSKHAGPEYLRFAMHVDGQPAATWTAVENIPTGWSPDDHVNLKADSAGNLFVATKTSEDDDGRALILLLRRTAATGTWTSGVYSRVDESNTRPIVELDESAGVAHVFATCPQGSGSGQSGGDICEKTTSMSGALTFPVGQGTHVIRDVASQDTNDATSTKQNVSAATGIVVLASNKDTGLYYFSDRPLGSAPLPQPPGADFAADVTSGTGSLRVTFTDRSSNAPTSWAWDFGDGGTSNERHPVHTYAPGTYTVRLTATNAGGATTAVRQGLIQVAALDGGGAIPGGGLPSGDPPVGAPGPGAAPTSGAGAAPPVSARAQGVIITAPTLVPYGGSARIEVRLVSGAAGVPLQLQAAAHPFATPYASRMGPAVSDGQGRYAFIVPAIRSTTRFVVVAGGSQVSPVVTIRSALATTFTGIHRSRGLRAVVTGRVSPVTRRAVAVVQRRARNGTWVPLRYAGIPRTGRFRIGVDAFPGQRLRVVTWAMDGGAHVSGTSATAVVPRRLYA